MVNTLHPYSAQPPPQDEREWELSGVPALQINDEASFEEGSERLTEMRGKVTIIQTGLAQERSDRQERIAKVIQALPTVDNLSEQVHVAAAVPTIDFSLPEEAVRCPTLEGHCDSKHCTVETRVYHGETSLTDMALSDCVPKAPEKNSPPLWAQSALSAMKTVNLVAKPVKKFEEFVFDGVKKGGQLVVKGTEHLCSYSAMQPTCTAIVDGADSAWKGVQKASSAVGQTCDYSAVRPFCDGATSLGKSAVTAGTHTLNFLETNGIPRETLGETAGSLLSLSILIPAAGYLRSLDKPTPLLFIRDGRLTASNATLKSVHKKLPPPPLGYPHTLEQFVKRVEPFHFRTKHLEGKLLYQPISNDKAIVLFTRQPKNGSLIHKLGRYPYKRNELSPTGNFPKSMQAAAWQLADAKGFKEIHWLYEEEGVFSFAPKPVMVKPLPLTVAQKKALATEVYQRTINWEPHVVAGKTAEFMKLPTKFPTDLEAFLSQAQVHRFGKIPLGKKAYIKGSLLYQEVGKKRGVVYLAQSHARSDAVFNKVGSWQMISSQGSTPTQRIQKMVEIAENLGKEKGWTKVDLLYREKKLPVAYTLKEAGKFDRVVEAGSFFEKLPPSDPAASSVEFLSGKLTRLLLKIKK